MGGQDVDVGNGHEVYKHVREDVSDGHIPLHLAKKIMMVFGGATQW